MTFVSHYSGPVLPYGEELMWVQLCRFRFLMTSLAVVEESLDIYSTVEWCGVPRPFYQNFPSLLTPSNFSPCQSTKRYTGGLDRCASTIINISSIQFAMYPFSKCRFALLMRTRSPTLNLGLPTLSWPHKRCHTVSWLVLFTSDGAIPVQPVIGVFVRSHKGLQDVDVSNRLVFREITPHTCLQGPIEPLHNARLRFFVVRRKVMHTVLF